MNYLKVVKAILNLIEKLAANTWSHLHNRIDKAKRDLAKAYTYENDRHTRMQHEETLRYGKVVGKLNKRGNDLDTII